MIRISYSGTIILATGFRHWTQIEWLNYVFVIFSWSQLLFFCYDWKWHGSVEKSKGHVMSCQKISNQQFFYQESRRTLEKSLKFCIIWKLSRVRFEICITLLKLISFDEQLMIIVTISSVVRDNNISGQILKKYASQILDTTSRAKEYDQFWYKKRRRLDKFIIDSVIITIEYKFKK